MKSNFSFATLAHIPFSLQTLKDPPKHIFYTGNIALLDKSPKVAIIGTRHPNQYSQIQTAFLAKEIQKAGGVILSGGALGTDIIAHKAALPDTILISPASLDVIYPATNAPIIKQIAKEGLILSEYEHNPIPKQYEFLLRNRLVVALSDIIIIPQADLQSGSLYSAKLCLEANKPLFVLPHRLNESQGTQNLLQNSQAKAIYDVSLFLKEIGLDSAPKAQDDAILRFCMGNPSFEEAYLRFGDSLLEYELLGKISRHNGRIIIAN